ncbi:MAG: hypothetical protein H7175_21875, partial [Burkholderiales bacterium]|nr:hypothetical protein [Anaerolineae bacterium]
NFLLRQDVERPFSTDTMVWLDVFSADKLTVPSWYGIRQETWADLAEMKQVLDAGWGDDWKPCRVIAITMLRQHASEHWPIFGYIPQEDGSQIPFGYDHAAKHLVPATLDNTWSLLGYDVSDPFLLSGLMNCGYGERLNPLRERFAQYLNQYHLFNDLEAAFEFRAITNEQVREHAPFYVYGLYLQPSQRGEG